MKFSNRKDLLLSSLLQVSLIPAYLNSVQNAMSVRSHLRKVLGYSAGSIRKGQLPKLRKSRIEATFQKNMNEARRQAEVRGLDRDENERRIAVLETMMGKDGCNWVAFITVEEFVASQEFPLCKAIFADLDDQLFSSLLLLENNDYEGATSILENREVATRMGFKGVIGVLEAVQGVTDEQLANGDLQAVQQAQELLIFEILAALDVEYISVNFPSCRIESLLTQVAPIFGSVDAEQLKGRKTQSRKFPYARMIQFIHAILFRKKHMKWPAKPIGRKEFAAVSGIHEYPTDNLFDGTRKLSQDEFDKMVGGLCKYFGFDYSVLPIPIVVLLFAQIMHSISVVIGPSGQVLLKPVRRLDEYLKIVEQRRKDWVGQIGEGTIDMPPYLTSGLLGVVPATQQAST
jgi:hypothetical protein